MIDRLYETLGQTWRAMQGRLRRPQQSTGSPLDMRSLESRVLYSAVPLDIGALADAIEPIDFQHDQPHVDDHGHDLATDSAHDIPSAADGVDHRGFEESGWPSATRTELVVVDISTPDYATLMRDIATARETDVHLEFVLLDSNRDGVEQITDALQEYEQLDALHIISHGADGRLRLGDTWLTAQTANTYASDLVKWRDSLSTDADLLLYGCNLAATSRGEELLDALQALCDCDVAASDDLTGASALGGDWVLEYQSGTVETSALLSGTEDSNWFGALAVATFQEGASSYTGTTDTEIQQANPGTNQGSDTSIAIDAEYSGGETQGLIHFPKSLWSGLICVDFG